MQLLYFMISTCNAVLNKKIWLNCILHTVSVMLLIILLDSIQDEIYNQ
jgi:hypothetical protein